MRATSTQLLEQLEQSLSRLDAPFNGYRSTIHIHDRNDKEKKKRLLRRNCARADVEITYPRPSPGAGRLEVSVANGELALKMSPPGQAWDGTLTSFEQVRLKLLNGGINFDNLVVSRALHVEVANGHIRGNVHTAGTIAAQTMNGQIQLGIDTNPLRADWSPSNLMVNAETLNGEIELNMVRKHLKNLKYHQGIRFLFFLTV
jgi:hypothetical protein